MVNYEVVLASGHIVNANAETNTDIWIALKGRGNNFGIVTRFHLRVFEFKKQMWGGNALLFAAQYFGQIQSLVDYLHDTSPDTDIHIGPSLGYAAALGHSMCMNDIFCASPRKPKSLEPFSDIPPQIDQMNTLCVGDLKKFTDEAFAGASSNTAISLRTSLDVGR